MLLPYTFSPPIIKLHPRVLRIDKNGRRIIPLKIGSGFKPAGVHVKTLL
jgi:hypothetical protein